MKIVAVVGCGTMGIRIAQCASLAGFNVRLLDGEPDIAHKERDKIASVLARVTEQGKLTAELAKNTSSMSIPSLSTGLLRPEQFQGIRIFNAVSVLPLVELVRGRAISDESIAAANAFVEAIGKVAITVANRPGFVVNRLVLPLINEAFMLLEECVATAVEIDPP